MTGVDGGGLADAPKTAGQAPAELTEASTPAEIEAFWAQFEPGGYEPAP